jgi:hypothetical protein
MARSASSWPRLARRSHPAPAGGVALLSRSAPCLVTTCGPDASTSFSLRWVLAAEAPNMNDTQRWLVGLRPRHNPAENALIANMRDDSNIPYLKSLADMRHYARQRWTPPGTLRLIAGLSITLSPIWNLCIGASTALSERECRCNIGRSTGYSHASQCLFDCAISRVGYRGSV